MKRSQKKFGRGVRAFREYHGLSPEEFGKVIGLSPRTVESIEADRRPLMIDHIACICKKFHMNADTMTKLLLELSD